MPLAVKFEPENCHAGDIAGRPGKRSNESLANHVIRQCQDRNVPRCPLTGTNSGITARLNQVDSSFDQLRRVLFELLDTQSVAASVHSEIVAFDETGVPQLGKERDVVCASRGAENTLPKR